MFKVNLCMYIYKYVYIYIHIIHLYTHIPLLKTNNIPSKYHFLSPWFSENICQAHGGKGRPSVEGTFARWLLLAEGSRAKPNPLPSLENIKNISCKRGGVGDTCLENTVTYNDSKSHIEMPIKWCDDMFFFPRIHWTIYNLGWNIVGMGMGMGHLLRSPSKIPLLSSSKWIILVDPIFT